MTTSAQKSTPEHHPRRSRGSATRECEIHGPYETKVLEVFGEKTEFSRCPKCAEETIRREEQRTRHQEIARLWSASDIPLRFRPCTIDKFRDEGHKGRAYVKGLSQRYIHEFSKHKELGRSLIFCGGPGTGKTHLACSIAAELIRQRYTVKYVSEYNLLNSIKGTWSQNSERSELTVLRSFHAPNLLIIDEVGVSFGSETDKVLLYQVVNGRYERSLPTILVGNLTERELISHVGERVIDRLRENGGVVVAFSWESYRR